MVAIGGWWLSAAGAPAWTLFALVGAAMVVFGLATAGAVLFTRWGNESRNPLGNPKPKVA
jgi:hypothetical protein